MVNPWIFQEEVGSVENAEHYLLKIDDGVAEVAITNRVYDATYYTLTLTIDTSDPDWLPSEVYELRIIGSVENACDEAQTNDVSVYFRTESLISVKDAVLTEGDDAENYFMIFNVNLSPPNVDNVTVSYVTVDESAVAGTDYLSASGVLTFSPGMTNQPVAVTILGDTNPEPNEKFHLVLSAPQSASIEDSTGWGTIINNDSIICNATGSVSLLDADSDSWIDEGSPTVNSGTATILLVRPDNMDVGNNGLFHFDLAGLPAEVTIECAMLELEIKTNTGGPEVYVHRLAQPWVENEVTWLETFQWSELGSAGW